MTTDKMPTPHRFFEAVSRVIIETLGVNHPCALTFAKARASSDPADMEAAMETVRSLPPFFRDNILLEAKKSLVEDSQFIEWLSRKLGEATEVPPNATRH